MIAGPTATGKSEVAVEVASQAGGEIVNADSVQLYKHCDIGTAKPPKELREMVPHYLYDILEPDIRFSAGEYEKLAETMVVSIAKRDRLPIVVGGTGLYIKALLWGLSISARREPRVRERLEREWQSSKEGLYQRLLQVDPEYGSKLSPNDKTRIIRALEIFETTNTPPSSFSQWSPKSWITPITVALDLPRERLKERIEKRAESMVEMGLIEETKKILSMGYPKDSPPLQAIGYRQVVQHLEGKLSKDQMIAELKKATWKYSKRQRTWFKKESFTWVNAEERDIAVKRIKAMVSQESRKG